MEYVNGGDLMFHIQAAGKFDDYRCWLVSHKLALILFFFVETFENRIPNNRNE